MKAHNNSFKENISTFGKQIDSIITYEIDGTRYILGMDDLNGVTPHFEGDILKSVMKELDIDSNVDIPLGTIVNYKFGVSVGGDFDYVDYGNYIVYSSDYNADTLSYEITCYDKMLNTMCDYEPLEIIYPTTTRNYIAELCNRVGLVFKDINTNFVNYDKLMPTELYKDIGYTFRDVLDELAQVTASTICVNQNDELEIRYITETNDTIDENFLSDNNVVISKKYGPINSIVLSRAGGADSIYKADEESIERNGLHELKIQDNQIMNGNDRDQYLNDLFEKLNGLEYMIYNFDSPGIAYYDLCDRFTVQIYGENYSCVLLNDELNVTQGLKENLYVEEPEETETDYKYVSSTDQTINQAYIIAKKSEGEIEELAKKITDMTTTISSNDFIKIEDGSKNPPIKLSIIGNLRLLYPSDNLYPNDDLYPVDTYLIVENKDGEKNKFHLPIKELKYLDSNNYDEFVLENNQAKIIHKNYDEEITEDLGVVNVELFENYNLIYMESFSNLKYKMEYIYKSEFSSIYATKVETQAAINISSNSINQNVNAKFDLVNGEIKDINGSLELKIDKDDNDRVVSMINASADIIKLDSDRFILNSTNCKIDETGTITATNANLVNGSFTNGYISIFQEPTAIHTPIYIEQTNQNGENTKNYITSGSFRINKDGINRYNLRTDGNNCYIRLYDNSGKDNIVLNGNSGIIWCVSLNQTSLEKNKKNFEIYQDGLKEVMNTDIYKYHHKNQDDNEKKHIGFVIGENYNYSKKITSVDEEGFENGVDLYSMISVAYKAIQEQQKQIEELKKEINILKGND